MILRPVRPFQTNGPDTNNRALSKRRANGLAGSSPPSPVFENPPRRFIAIASVLWAFQVKATHEAFIRALREKNSNLHGNRSVGHGTCLSAELRSQHVEDPSPTCAEALHDLAGWLHCLQRKRCSAVLPQRSQHTRFEDVKRKTPIMFHRCCPYTTPPTQDCLLDETSREQNALP